MINSSLNIAARTIIIERRTFTETEQLQCNHQIYQTPKRPGGPTQNQAMPKEQGSFTVKKQPAAAAKRKNLWIMKTKVLTMRRISYIMLTIKSDSSLLPQLLLKQSI
jgi:hypothetical protein